MISTTTYQQSSLRSANGGYRYFFNGQECDGEVFGDGVLHAFEYRMHDTRTGRFWSVDPLAGKFPWNSVYAFAMKKYLFFIVVVTLVSCQPTSLIKTSTLENKVDEVYDFLRPYKDSIPCFVEAEKWPVEINSSLGVHNQGISIEEVFHIRDNILFSSLFGKNKNTEYRMIIITSDKKLLFYKEFAEGLIKEEENGTYGRYAIGKLTYYPSFSPAIDSQIESLTVIGNSYCPYRIDTLQEMFDYSDAILNKMDSVTIRF